MEDILKKISKYDILVYLAPGCLMVAIPKAFCDVNLLLDNLVIDCIIIYSYGIVCEIVGSAVFSLLDKMKIIDFVEYDDFIRINKDKNKIGIISRKVSIYKSIVGAIFCSIIICYYCKFIKILDQGNIAILVTGFIAIWIIIDGVKKQISYIKKRMKAQAKSNKKIKK